MKRSFFTAILSCFFILLSAQDQCFISGFSYKLERTSPDDFLIRIDNPNDLSQNYNVFINGEKQELPAIIMDSPYYFGPYPIDCEVFYELYIERIDNESCNIMANIGQVCSFDLDCEFKNIEHDVLACDGEFAKVKLSFKPVNTLGEGFDLIAGNGDFLGFFLYEELPVIVEYPYIDAAEVKFEIIDNDNQACSATYPFFIECDPDQCYISDLSFSVPECSPNGSVFVTLAFEHQNTSDSFYVKGNGNEYGLFSYADLPIEIGPIQPNCAQDYEFVVVDAEKPDCAEDIGGIRICCPGECIEPIFEIVYIECGDAVIEGKLQLGTEYIVEPLYLALGNIEVEDYEIEWPFIYFRAANITGSLSNTITICQNFIDIECCYSESFSFEDCGSSDECEIGGLEYELLECDDNNQAYFWLNFDHKNTSESFLLTTNGVHYDTFSYEELPLTIGPIDAQCTLPFEIGVYDLEDPDCANHLDNLALCCNSPCEEPGFEIISLECDSTYIFIKAELKFDFSVEPFQVSINGTPINAFEIDFPYIYIEAENNASSISNTLEICTISPSGQECCYREEFSTEDCSPSTSCKIYGIEYSYPECDDTGLVPVSIDFKYQNVGETFVISGNGNSYGEFAYSDLPVTFTVIPNCNFEYEFVIKDQENPNCGNYIENVVICCPGECPIPAFEIQNIECNDEFVFMKVELIQPIIFDDFKVLLSGNPIEEYEVDLPYIYLQFPIPLTTDIPVLSICYITGIGDCCYEESFSLADCFPSDECRIGDIKVEAADCDTGVPPTFTLDFEYINTGQEGFNVKGGGIDYGDFKYEDLPITLPASNDCSQFYEFIVTDNENPNCSNFNEYGFYCCNDQCSFEAEDIMVSCENDFITSISFFLFEATDPIKTYTVFVNGEVVAEFGTNNELIDIQTEIPLIIQDEYVMTICDGDCCQDYGLDVEECFKGGECSISSIETNELNCSDEGLDFILDLKHENTSGDVFDLYSLFGYHGSYAYDDLPIKVEGFPTLGFGTNILFICDDDSFCCNAHIFNPPSCSPFGEETDEIEFPVTDEDVIFIRQNPTNDLLHLLSPERNTSYRVLDAEGNLVLEFESTEFAEARDISNLESGLYFVQIRTKKGLQTEKLIITK